MQDYESFYQRIDYERLDPAPEVQWTPEAMAACRERWRSLRQGQPASAACADWIFLQYLVEHEGLLLHGSPNPAISRFEPRTAGNAFKDGQTPKVYASDSVMLAWWYAIVDRDRLREICGTAKFGMIYAPVHPQTKVRGARHFFHVSHEAFPLRPFKPGTIYVLPGDSFTPEYLKLQWYAEKPVAPLAALTVSPAGWPMLHQVRALNWSALPEDPQGRIPPFDTPGCFPMMGVMTWP